MPPPTARSKQDIGAASTFFGALVTMSAANVGADKSASAANEVAIVFFRAISVPTRAVRRERYCSRRNRMKVVGDPPGPSQHGAEFSIRTRGQARSKIQQLLPR